MQDQIVFYAFHSFLVEVEMNADYKINVLCMNNSNLGIMIAGNQRSLQCNYSKSPYSLSPPQKGLETRGRDGNFQRGAGL